MYFHVLQVCRISVEQLAVNQIFALSKAICYFVCFVRLYYYFRFSADCFDLLICIFLFIYLALNFYTFVTVSHQFWKIISHISSIATSLLFSLHMELGHTYFTSSHHISISHIHYFIFILLPLYASFLNFLSNFQFINSPVECNRLLTHSFKLYF